MSVTLPKILEHLGVELRPLNLVSRTPGIVCLGELELLPESLREVPVVLGAYVWHAQPGWAPIDRLELERWLVDAPSGCHWLVSERKLVEMRAPPRRDDIALILWGPKRISQWLGTAVLSGELAVDMSPSTSETMVNVAERAAVAEPPPAGVAFRPRIQLSNWFIEKGFEPLATQPLLLSAKLWTIEGNLVGPEDARERNSWTLLEDPFSGVLDQAGDFDALEHIPNLERLLPENWLDETSLRAALPELCEERRSWEVRRQGDEGTVLGNLLHWWRLDLDSAAFTSREAFLPAWKVNAPGRGWIIVHGLSGRMLPWNR
ncbi:MAG: hypothetical protein MK233_03925 [Candidatus Poseidoniales archaeon]|nr:hypothetical protein [Candidatus Poseidoniales archaeon]